MEPRTIHIQCILLYHILVVHTCRHIISVTCKIWTRVFTGFMGLRLRGFAFMHHIFNIYSTQNQKLNAWQYVSASWFDECDPGVSGCQSLHGSGAVKPNTFKVYDMRYKVSQPLLASTPFVHISMLTWSHFVIVHYFSAFQLTLIPIMIQIFFPTRWHWLNMRAARARSSKPYTRANTSALCLHMAIY